MRSDTRLISRITTFVVIGLLSACGASEMTDLKQFVSDKAERPGGLIEPIPTFTAYEAFAYSAAGMRSPFDRPIEVVELTTLRLRSSLAPDRNRPGSFWSNLTSTAYCWWEGWSDRVLNGLYCATQVVVSTECARGIMWDRITVAWLMLARDMSRSWKSLLTVRRTAGLSVREPWSWVRNDARK